MAQLSLDHNKSIVTLPSAVGAKGVGLDWWLLGSAAALLYVGLVIIMSASIDVAEARSGNPFLYATKHGVFLCVALIAGIDMRVQFPNPLRPGDRVRSRLVTNGKRLSSKPGRGVVEVTMELVNQNGDRIITAEAVWLVATRP